MADTTKQSFDCDQPRCELRRRCAAPSATPIGTSRVHTRCAVRDPSTDDERTSLIDVSSSCQRHRQPETSDNVQLQRNLLGGTEGGGAIWVI
jgi:hypothetical protein